MGYTHYFTQTRDFTNAEWAEVAEAARAILDQAEQRHEVRIADWQGTRGSTYQVDDQVIRFNGSGDDACETFLIQRKRSPKDVAWLPKGSGFCKTNRLPYDKAVTAILCYLSSFQDLGEAPRRPVIDVRSDGRGVDYLAGLELARQALPRHDNQLDLPMSIMKDDRWCAPWCKIETKAYDFRFCVDGYAYIWDTRDPSRIFRFNSHLAAAQYASRELETGNKDMRFSSGPAYLFDAYGSFNEARRRSIARQQADALRHVLDATWSETLQAWGTWGEQPPAFVRPGQLPPITPAYNFNALLQLGKAA